MKGSVLLVALRGFVFIGIVFFSSLAWASSPAYDYLRVKCADLEVRFDAANNWTMGGIRYVSKQMTVDGTQTAYGTVASIAGVGFVGSAHTENGSELITSLSATLDGVPVDLMNVNDVLTGDSFEFRRVGMARDLQIDSTVKISNGRMHSSTTISATSDVSLNLLYNFMCPWSVNSSNYLANTTNQGLVSGEFGGTGDFVLAEPCNWLSVYFDQMGVGAVSNILEVPDDTEADALLWDVSSKYHKFYLRSYEATTLPADYSGTFEMITTFFESTPENWESTATNIAAQVPEPGTFCMVAFGAAALLRRQRKG